MIKKYEGYNEKFFFLTQTKKNVIEQIKYFVRRVILRINKFEEYNYFFIKKEESIAFYSEMKERLFYVEPVSTNMLFNKWVINIIKYPYALFIESYLEVNDIMVYIITEAMNIAVQTMQYNPKASIFYRVKECLKRIGHFMIIENIMWYVLKPKIANKIFIFFNTPLITNTVLLLFPAIDKALSTLVELSIAALILFEIGKKNEFCKKRFFQIKQILKNITINIYLMMYNNIDIEFLIVINTVKTIESALMFTLSALVMGTHCIGILAYRKIICKGEQNVLSKLKKFWTKDWTEKFAQQNNTFTFKEKSAAENKTEQGKFQENCSLSNIPAGYFAFHFFKSNLKFHLNFYKNTFFNQIRSKIHIEKMFFNTVLLNIFNISIQDIKEYFQEKSKTMKTKYTGIFQNLKKIKNLFVKEGKNSKKSKRKRNTYVMEKDSRKIYMLEG